MRRSTAILACSLILILVACSPGQAAVPTTTTSTLPVVTAPGETTTSLEPTTLGGSEGFRTRRAGVLVIGTERLTPPWFVGPTAGDVTSGFDYALAHEIGSRLGVPLVQVVRTSLVLMMTGQDCKCDVMLGGITITDSRARALDLSEPYLSADQAVLVRAGTLVSNQAETAALRWGVAVRNTTGQDVITNRVKPTVRPEIVVDDEEAIRRLGDGRLDAVLLETPDALAVAHADPRFVVTGQYHTGELYAVALSLGSPNTALINDVIRSMRDDGIINALSATYLGARPDAVPVIPS